MRKLQALLHDRRRSQRGSVLSGVLIITAFIAIISGALMTELSGNMLLSRALINRVANQATDNSAVELALSRLQVTPLNAPCPTLAATSVNSLQAAPSYLSCWPTVREAQKVTFVGGQGSAFPTDGTHARAGGLDDYVVGDGGGNLYDIPFGSSAPRWTIGLGRSVTATPLVIQMPGGSNQVLDVVPIEGSMCGPVEDCLAVARDTVGSASQPSIYCAARTAAGKINAQPSPSPTQAGMVYFGAGTQLIATDISDTAGGSGVLDCEWEANGTIPNNEQLKAPAAAFRCASGCGISGEAVLAAVSNGSTSHLVEFTYSRPVLNLVGSLSLPGSSVAGIAVSTTNLPADIAITFTSGGVAVAHVASDGTMSLAATAATGSGVVDAPYWCHCAGGDLIGVGASNGGLYVYDTGLQLYAVYGPGGPGISTSPMVDAAGNWFFGASDGSVHEVQVRPGQATQMDTFGPMGSTTSGVQVGGCSIGICIYLAAADRSAYLVPLDARRAIISACITTAPPACSGANPRLWASVEVGVSGNPQAVHVEGWSYYSG